MLDFEIAGADLRVNDLVAALAACTHAPDPADDDHVGALCGGFGSVLRLAPAEVEALPDLLRGGGRSAPWCGGLATGCAGRLLSAR